MGVKYSNEMTEREEGGVGMSKRTGGEEDEESFWTGRQMSDK